MTEFIFANVFAGNDNSKAFSLDLAKPPSIWRLSGKGKRLHIFVEKKYLFSLFGYRKEAAFCQLTLLLSLNIS